MKTGELIADQPARLWRFLGFFQPPFLRVLHALVALLVFAQFCSSAFMGVWSDGASWSGWLHMFTGMGLCVLGLILAWYSLVRHGLRYFFPYLWGDTGQLRKDLSASLRGHLVGPRPKGLAASVQGLGLGALLLTAFCGLIWFWLWRGGSSWADDLRIVHEWAAQLVIWYFIGHGGMALIHFVRWQRTAAKT